MGLPQSRWLAVTFLRLFGAVKLTLIPTSATLLHLTSLLQTGFGMFSARAGYGRPGCAERRFLINSWGKEGDKRL
jgi:hypothetical protein